MSFYRHARIFIGFDCVDYDGNVHIIYGGDVREMEFDPVVFDSRSEAFSLGGDIRKWADKIAENIAKAEAENYCGEETFRATNVNWIFRSEREWGDITSDLRANIVVRLERIRDNLDNMTIVESELIPQLDRYLDKKGLTRDDIRDIIEEVGLENIVT